MTLPSKLPGTYAQEVPANTAIQGVPTAIAAFVGSTAAGPVGQPVLVTSWAAYQQVFGGLAWQAMVSWAVWEFFTEGGSSCHVLRVADEAAATPAQASAGGLALQASTPGHWGNALHVLASPLDGDTTDTARVTLSVLVDAADPPDLRGYLQQNQLNRLDSHGQTWVVLEQFGPGTAGEVLAQLQQQSIFVHATQTGPAAWPADGAPVALAGGTEARLDIAAALKLLDAVPDISLLAVPDTVNATGPDGQPSLALQATLINAALQYCEQRGSVFCVADAPAGLDVKGVQAFKTGRRPESNPTALSSSCGALYYPWVFAYNAATGTNVPMPASGPVLGRYASTDAAVGVWQAPAGVTYGALRSVTQLAWPLTDAEQAVLNPDGINGLRTLVDCGNTIWGARTLSAQQEWTYLSVRRLVIYVEQSLLQGLRWTVFEPNDPAVRSRVSREASQFLAGLWQQGALFGASAAEAFFVACDTSNNPPETMADGLLYLDIGLAPVYPAEFTVLRMTLRTVT